MSGTGAAPKALAFCQCQQVVWLLKDMLLKCIQFSILKIKLQSPVFYHAGLIVVLSSFKNKSLNLI